jgi:hypothetical protein
LVICRVFTLLWREGRKESQEIKLYAIRAFVVKVYFLIFRNRIVSSYHSGKNLIPITTYLISHYTDLIPDKLRLNKLFWGAAYFSSVSL